jgi:hypothetical protein
MITIGDNRTNNIEVCIFPVSPVIELYTRIPSQPILRTCETHSLPPPSVHSSLLHLTAEVSHRLALEKAGGSFHLLRIRCIFALHFGDA